MPETKLTIRHDAGLHARPASLFVQTANQFDATIEVSYDDQKANAKSILSVLTLGAGPGAEITIHADGDDAEAALQALEALVQGNFRPQEVEQLELETPEEQE